MAIPKVETLFAALGAPFTLREFNSEADEGPCLGLLGRAGSIRVTSCSTRMTVEARATQNQYLRSISQGDGMASQGGIALALVHESRKGPILRPCPRANSIHWRES